MRAAADEALHYATANRIFWPHPSWGNGHSRGGVSWPSRLPGVSASGWKGATRRSGRRGMHWWRRANELINRCADDEW